MTADKTATAGTRGRVRSEPGHKRVRAYLGGELVVDTVNPVLVWEGPHYPVYYLPVDDVRAALVPNGGTTRSPSRGEAVRYDVKAGGATAADAAWRYPDSPLEELRGLVRFEWDAMDDWFEEDEPVYVHPRNPYHRVDILASSRQVRVEIDGVTVAESNRPHVLFETGLPARFYVPLTDVDHRYLRPSDTETACPYKGTAGYFSVEVEGKRVEDAAWIYRYPLAESAKIAGLVCFYPDRAEVYVDGTRI